MSNGTETPKKGLPAIAWVGIGCGALIVILAIVFTVGGYFVTRKVKDVAAEFEENPELAAARMLVKLNPELEEVSADEENGTITIRKKDTGEEITVDFEDIEEGRLSWSEGDRKVTIDSSGSGETGTVSVTDGENSMVMTTGDAASGELPGWVPVFPGTEPTNRHSMKAGEVVNGGFETAIGAPLAAALEYYRNALDEEGFDVKVTTFSEGEGNEGGMINANDQSGKRTVVVLLEADGGTTNATVSYSQGS